MLINIEKSYTIESYYVILILSILVCNLDASLAILNIILVDGKIIIIFILIFKNDEY